MSEKTWRRVFRWDRRGGPRTRLAELFGVTVGTIAYQAAKRGLRKGETPGCVDRRRRPEGGWPDDHVFHQSGMTPARWRALLERRIAGEVVEDLAAEYGVCVATIGRQARQMGMRKMDRPDARYLPRGPAQGAYGYSGIRDLLKITVDRDDPVGTVRRIDEAIWARLDKGDGSEAGTLWRHRRMVAQQLGITTPEVRARFEQEVREQRLRLPAPEAFGRSSRVASEMWPGLGASLGLEAGMTPGIEAGRAPSTALWSPSPASGGGSTGLVLHAHQRPPEGTGGRGWWAGAEAVMAGLVLGDVA